MIASHKNLYHEITVGHREKPVDCSVKNLQDSGGFGGQMGATAPLHDKNSALAPPFWQEKHPLS